MQHAVGAPLPPPQGPGNGPAGWTHQAQHPGHPGPPGPPPPPAPQGQGQGWTGPAPHHAPAPVSRETTGHVQL
ncbi:Pro-rich N-terminal domain-containing protein, partial [Streptomyces sp. 900116325]